VFFIANTGILSNSEVNRVLNRAYDSSTTYTVPSVSEIGSDSTAATTSDSSLYNRIPHTRTSIDECNAIAGWTHEGDGQQVVLNETEGDFREGTGCLNTPVTYAGGTAGWYKTVGAVNVSGKFVGMFFYISSKTNLTSSNSAVRLTLGTGGFVNTNYYDFADTAISVGWNFLIITVDSPTGTSGSGATETNIDRIKITVRTTGDYTGTQLRMDEWWYATEANFERSLTAGYPSFDTLNKIATMRFDYTATEVNGFDIGEQKADNTDASAIQAWRVSHNTFTKSSLYEVAYIIRIQGNAQ